MKQIKFCVVCKGPMDGQVYKNRLYCSKKCKQIAYLNRRQKEFELRKLKKLESKLLAKQEQIQSRLVSLRLLIKNLDNGTL